MKKIWAILLVILVIILITFFIVVFFLTKAEHKEGFVLNQSNDSKENTVGAIELARTEVNLCINQSNSYKDTANCLLNQINKKIEKVGQKCIVACAVDWGVCEANGWQYRDICVQSSYCDKEVELARVCGVCRENWTCSNWNSCSSNNQQVRDCWDSNHCGTTNNKPDTTKSCSEYVNESNFPNPNEVYDWLKNLTCSEAGGVTCPSGTICPLQTVLTKDSSACCLTDSISKCLSSADCTSEQKEKMAKDTLIEKFPEYTNLKILEYSQKDNSELYGYQTSETDFIYCAKKDNDNFAFSIHIDTWSSRNGCILGGVSDPMSKNYSYWVFSKGGTVEENCAPLFN